MFGSKALQACGILVGGSPVLRREHQPCGEQCPSSSRYTLAPEAQRGGHELVDVANWTPESGGSQEFSLAVQAKHRLTKGQEVTRLKPPSKSATEPRWACPHPQSRAYHHVTSGLVRPSPEPRPPLHLVSSAQPIGILHPRGRSPASLPVACSHQWAPVGLRLRLWLITTVGRG